VVQENSPSARVVELDALRGLAAVAVMAYHYTTRYSEQIGHVGGMPLDLLAGKYGVQLFFLISGFVIFMTLERTRTAMDFVVSRFSRLFPAYWTGLSLTALVVYTIGLPIQQLPLRDLLSNYTMVQEFLGFEHLDGSYWTLQIELFFYVQMLMWFLLGQLKRIHWIIATWLVLAAIEGLCEKHQVHFSYALRELMILRFIPFFAMGILFYRLRQRPEEWRLNVLMIALSLLAIAVGERPIFLAVAVFCCAVFTAFTAGWLRFLNRRVFAFLGEISYSLYLVHQAIGFVVIYYLEKAGVHALAAVALAMGFALLLAFAMNRLVEKPAMRAIRGAWKRREQPRVASQACEQGIKDSP